MTHTYIFQILLGFKNFFDVKNLLVNFKINLFSHYGEGGC